MVSEQLSLWDCGDTTPAELGDVNLWGLPQHPTGALAPVEDALPFNVWLVGQRRSRDVRDELYADEGQNYHSQKMPPDLAARMIEHLRIAPNSIVADPFAGTGTTGIEALRRGYRFAGLDCTDGWADVLSANVDRLKASGWRPDGLGHPHAIASVGDARDIVCWDARSMDAIVTSPPYGDCDPTMPRSNTGGGQRMENTSHYREIVVADHDLRRLGERDYFDAMSKCLGEMYRVLKPGGYILMAVREFWNDRGLIDLPGEILSLARMNRLVPWNRIFAIEAALDEHGLLRSRQSAHRHRIARREHADGRACPRGVPAVTQVLVMRRRPAS